MRAGFNRAFAVVLDFTAPEKYLALFVRGLQLEPDVKGIDRTSWEEMADFAGSNDHIHEIIVATAHGSLHTTERRSDGPRFALGSLRRSEVCFFADGESGGKFLAIC